MRNKFYIGVIMAALIVACPASADCLDPKALTSGHSEYVRVGPQPGSGIVSYSISFEPDATGTETTAILGLQMCSRETTASCLDYNFDTTGNGVGDTNDLDGTAIEKSGVKNIQGFLFLRVFASTNPSGDDEPEFTICRHFQ